MEEKEFLKKNDPTYKLLHPTEEEEGPSPFKVGMLRVFTFLLTLAKLILGLMLLPFVYSISVSFFNTLRSASAEALVYFFAGIFTLLVVHLFVWELKIVYNAGCKLLALIFSFIQPLVRIAPYVLPTYTIIIFIIYSVVLLFSKSQEILHYFIFLFGFSMSLHLVFSSRSLRTRRSDFLRSNYIFGFCLIYMVNLVLVATFLNLVIADYSLITFFRSSFRTGENILVVILAQLFYR
jgi:hypothetical protein